MSALLDRCPPFSQLALGLIPGCAPIPFLMLAAALGLTPFYIHFFIYCGLGLLFYWFLRPYPWLFMGACFSLLNLIPLYFFSRQEAWQLFFGDETSFFTMVIYHLPTLAAFAGVSRGEVRLPAPRSPKLKGQMAEAALELAALAMPWLLLGLMKSLDIDPFGWPLLFYLAVLMSLGGYYSSRIMIPSIIRSDPLQSVLGISVMAVWIYLLALVFFYCFRDSRFFSPIYSDKIDFLTVSLYYELLFAGFILMHIRHAGEINEAVEKEDKRRRAEDEDLERWFGEQSTLRAKEKEAGLIPEDPALVAWYELAGLSFSARRADLERARLYWERKLNPKLNGNFSESLENEAQALKAIRMALEAIVRKLPKED